MADVIARDGVRLHWEERGQGPSVLLTPYWAMHPSVFDPIEAELEADTRVVRYDERGTGRSERTGPYDIATGVADLEAVCEEAGPFDVALCLVDASNRAVRVARDRPELIRTVLCVGAAPVGIGALSGSESLLSSQTVVRTYLQQLEADYRGAIRAALAGANTHLGEDEVRERVQAQIDHIDAEAAIGRAREWAGDTAGAEAGQALGSRLVVCLADTMGGPGSWFPSAHEMEGVIRVALPEAEVRWASDGIVSASREVANLVRELAGSRAQT